MRELLVKQKKNKNKGFSLVELIVVVLIIAIIAVSLAPQVMKWVGTSRTSVDDNNMATIKSSVSTAVAEFVSVGNTTAEASFQVNGVIGNVTGAYANYRPFIEDVLGTSDLPRPNTNGQNFLVTIAADGKVTVATVTQATPTALPTPTP